MRIKKYLLILLAINIFLLSINTSIAHASVVTKPVQVAAKKAVKELAQNSAVEMANQIVSEYLVRELIEGVKVDDGYSPICLSGSVSKIDECSADKRAQVKTNLTQADKQKLSSKVEEVIEKKTNTSSKMSKFLDWFIPIFLVSGAIAWIESVFSDDDKSLIDEIANEALLETDLIKPLTTTVGGGGGSGGKYNWEVFVSSVFVQDTSSNLLQTIVFTFNQPVQIYLDGQHLLTASDRVTWLTAYRYDNIQIENRYMSAVQLNYVQLDNKTIGSRNVLLWQSLESFTDQRDAWRLGEEKAREISKSIQVQEGTNNRAQSYYDTILTRIGNVQFFDVNGNNLLTNPPPPNVDLDVSTLKPINYTKYKNGDKIKIAGQENIPMKTPDGTRVYPKEDGTFVSGDGIPQEVDPETIIVEDVANSTDTDNGEDEEENVNACTDKIKLPSFKPIGNAFTTSFPFSIPWDIKRAIDSAFGGVGDTKPSFALTMFGDGVILTVPDMIDNWMPFLRGFLVLAFDISILYLFYRFMKGGE